MLQRESLRQLLSQIVPDERVDPAVEAFLLDVADDFVDSVVAFACKLAAHRRSDTLEVKDIVLHLERAWDMVLPGFETEELREFKPPPEARAHKKRMADVRRALARARRRRRRKPSRRRARRSGRRRRRRAIRRFKATFRGKARRPGTLTPLKTFYVCLHHRL